MLISIFGSSMLGSYATAPAYCPPPLPLSSSGRGGLVPPPADLLQQWALGSPLLAPYAGLLRSSELDDVSLGLVSTADLVSVGLPLGVAAKLRLCAAGWQANNRRRGAAESAVATQSLRPAGHPAVTMAAATAVTPQPSPAPHHQRRSLQATGGECGRDAIANMTAVCCTGGHRRRAQAQGGGGGGADVACLIRASSATAQQLNCSTECAALYLPLYLSCASVAGWNHQPGLSMLALQCAAASAAAAAAASAPANPVDVAGGGGCTLSTSAMPASSLADRRPPQGVGAGLLYALCVLAALAMLGLMPLFV
jgi:hypothetical protein